MPDIVDTSDFCRECRGTKMITETVQGYGYGQNRTITGTCWLCSGTGYRTVKVIDAYAR